MKIATIVAAFLPRWLTGTEVATYNIAKHLTKLGYEVHVTTSLDEGLPGESIEQGFCVDRVGFPRIRLVEFMLFWLRALLQLRKLKLKIVHQQSLMLIVGAVGFLAREPLKRSPTSPTGEVLMFTAMAT